MFAVASTDSILSADYIFSCVLEEQQRKQANCWHMQQSGQSSVYLYCTAVLCEYTQLPPADWATVSDQTLYTVTCWLVHQLLCVGVQSIS